VYGTPEVPFDDLEEGETYDFHWSDRGIEGCFRGKFHSMAKGRICDPKDNIVYDGWHLNLIDAFNGMRVFCMTNQLVKIERTFMESLNENDS
jgi:hypothetical protein